MRFPTVAVETRDSGAHDACSTAGMNGPPARKGRRTAVSGDRRRTDARTRPRYYGTAVLRHRVSPGSFVCAEATADAHGADMKVPGWS